MTDYEYVGGGYFREKGVTKGNVAEIVHAPELITQLKEQIAECARMQRKLLREIVVLKQCSPAPLIVSKIRPKRSKDEIIRVVRGLTLGTDADYEAVLEFCLELNL